VIALPLGLRVSPALVLRLYRGRQLGARDFLQGFAILEQLVRRAELDHMPSFWYLPCLILNAFTLGRRGNTAIAVADGIINALVAREGFPEANGSGFRGKRVLAVVVVVAFVLA